MRFLQRERDTLSGPSDPSGEPSGQLEGYQRAGAELLAAGDAAIQRALAGSDSEAFLAANRQQGGE
jgi:hypothetical protein